MTTTTTAVRPVTDAEFDAQVLQATGPVLVDFWASWCGPCRQLAPILEQLADEYEGRLTILKMDADANPATPATYRVTGLPTMNLFVDGQVVKSIVGVRPKAAIVADLTPHL